MIIVVGVDFSPLTGKSRAGENRVLDERGTVHRTAHIPSRLSSP